MILERARIDDRIVVTADLDYPRLLGLLEADRPGVILFRGGSYSDAEMLALLDRVLAQSGTLELERSITVVDQHRIRRRSLPIKDSAFCCCCSAGTRTSPCSTSHARVRAVRRSAGRSA